MLSIFKKSQLEQHIESLFNKGNLTSVNQFFAKNRDKTTAQLTSFGYRTLTVEGFEGSITFSKINCLLAQAAIDTILLEKGANERLKGIALTNRLVSLYDQTEKQAKAQNVFTRFAATQLINDTRSSLDNCKIFFQSYNLAQFQKKMSHIDLNASSTPAQETPKIEKIETHSSKMYAFDPSDVAQRYVEKATGRIVSGKEADTISDVRYITDSEKKTIFVVSRSQIKKLPKTSKQAQKEKEIAPQPQPIQLDKSPSLFQLIELPLLKERLSSSEELRTSPKQPEIEEEITIESEQKPMQLGKSYSLSQLKEKESLHSRLYSSAAVLRSN